MLKFALVVSRFNEEVTQGLLQGARDYFDEKGIHVDESDIFNVPGAFEIPLIAQKLAQTRKFSGIVCLGCVIKGETAHFEFISLGTTVGIIQIMLATNTAVSFGVLTTYTDDQASYRSVKSSHNKGREAAAACLETAETLLKIERL